MVIISEYFYHFLSKESDREHYFRIFEEIRKEKQEANGLSGLESNIKSPTKEHLRMRSSCSTQRFFVEDLNRAKHLSNSGRLDSRAWTF